MSALAWARGVLTSQLQNDNWCDRLDPGDGYVAAPDRAIGERCEAEEWSR